MVSARSSFFLLMRSLRVSASRRACWIRDCIASGDTSLAPCEFIVIGRCDDEGGGWEGEDQRATSDDERYSGRAQSEQMSSGVRRRTMKPMAMAGWKIGRRRSSNGTGWAGLDWDG